MVKISKPMGAGKVSTYYKMEFSAADQSYYREGVKELVGEWHGKLAAERFGLVGGVDREHYDRMALGQHPHSAERLIKHRLQAVDGPEHREHIAAWDMTFAPSKSYSAAALVGGDHRIIQWHKNALKEALDAGEAYTQARLGGNHGSLTTGNWAAACFLHDTARPVDGEAPAPHLHSHAVVFNMTGADKIRSVQSSEWYRIQSYMSSIYQSAMANQAMAGGYELDHGKNFSSRIKGFSDEYLNAISARTREIEEEKEKLGLSGAEADERINKRLRETKQQWEPEALRAEHQRQAREFGQNPEAIVQAALERQGVRLSEAARRRVAADGIEYAKERLQERSTVNDHFELVRDALRFGQGKIRVADVKAAFAERLGQRQNEFVEVQHYRVGAPGARYTTTKAKHVEADSIRVVLAGQGKTAPIAPALTSDQFRAVYAERQVNGKTITLNEAQLSMAYNVVSQPNQFAIVRGLAGSGKSTALQPIAELAALGSTVDAFRGQGYEVRGLASTSGAAANLSAIGIESGTLQLHNLQSVAGEARPRLYVVDEGSLIGAGMFHKFVQAVRPQDRVIVAYDPRQHQSVEAGRIIEELEEAGVATYALEQIVRQRNTPELLAVVNDFAAGRMLEGLDKLESQGRVVEISNRAERFRAMANWYATHEDVLMVAPDNRSIGELNLAARDALRSAGELRQDILHTQVLARARDVAEADKKRAVTYQPGDVVRWGKKSLKGQVQSGQYTTVVSIDGNKNLVTVQAGKRQITYDPGRHHGVELFEASQRSFAVGERIQVTRPWTVRKGIKISNRAQATIESLDANGQGVIVFDDGRRVKWNANQMPHVDYSYASTSYSLQFATAEQVLVHLDTGDSRVRSLLDRSLVYVGTSRGANEIRIYSDDKQTLLSDNSPVLRQTQKPVALSPVERNSISTSSAA